jgi:flavorubredoxin
MSKKGKAKKISKDLYYVGVRDPELRKFDVVMYTTYGTSYNAYLVAGKEKTALLDTVREGFFEEYLSKLESETDVEQIDYIVLSHAEPDHTGVLAELMEVCPDAQIVCTQQTSEMVRSICHEAYDYKIVQDGDELDLGGKTLKFITAPDLHWPDMILTYLPEDETLFSGDVFACHFDAEDVFDDWALDMLDELQRYYFEVLMNPYRSRVLKMLEKLENLKIRVICPTHGPILRKSADKAIKRYADWSHVSMEVNEVKRAFIGYVSCYGYTKRIAQEIAAGCEKEGLQVDLVDFSEKTLEQAFALSSRADVVAVGSPTVNADVMTPVWHFLVGLGQFECKKKPAAVFGSYGWSGEATEYITQRLKNVGLDVVGVCSVKLCPDEEALSAAFALGEELARRL